LIPITVGGSTTHFQLGFALLDPVSTKNRAEWRERLKTMSTTSRS